MTTEKPDDYVRVPLPSMPRHIYRLHKTVVEQLPSIGAEPVYMQSAGGWALKFRINQYDWSSVMHDGEGWVNESEIIVGDDGEYFNPRSTNDMVPEIAWLILQNLITEGQPVKDAQKFNEVLAYLIATRDTGATARLRNKAQFWLNLAVGSMRTDWR